jgi:hypothetical protein
MFGLVKSGISSITCSRSLFHPSIPFAVT